MRYFLVFLCVMLFAQASPAGAASFTDAQKKDLDRVSDYMNAIYSASGHFAQIGADGKSEDGTFYLRKPGRIRFEYKPPNTNLVISDGTTIAVRNTALKTTNRYPLLNSPLRLILSDSVDLATDLRIASVTREDGTLSVTARQNDGPARGAITLTFADTGSTLELRQWEVVDAQGLRTLVAITDMTQGADVPPRLFVIEDTTPFQNRNR